MNLRALWTGVALSVATPAAPSLTIYVVDTEGGKATLYVSPSGETVLIDAGNPGTRDADRIMEAVAAAGVKKIDYMISTHYHVDHIGGLVELSKRIPIGHYMDHGPTVEAREQVPGFQEAYAALRATAKHTVLKPGDRVPVAGLDWLIVTSAARAISAPLAGAGADNAKLCGDFQRRPEGPPDDNGQSVGSLITFGRFRAIDLGDLLWNNEFDLVCPRDLVGPVDLYMVTHHGQPNSGSPTLVHTIRPRVAVMSNGMRKGGAPEAFQILRSSPRLEDIWTLHWSDAAGTARNSPGAFIANVDDTLSASSVLNPTVGAPPGGRGRMPATHTPAHWIKISAEESGTFTVTNSRIGFSRTYIKP
jgi:competence protein ComEC